MSSALIPLPRVNLAGGHPIDPLRPVKIFQKMLQSNLTFEIEEKSKRTGGRVRTDTSLEDTGF